MGKELNVDEIDDIRFAVASVFRDYAHVPPDDLVARVEWITRADRQKIAVQISGLVTLGQLSLHGYKGRLVLDWVPKP